MTAERRDDPLVALSVLEGVPSAVAAARDAVDAVLRDRGLRRITAEQRAWSLLEGARANAALAEQPDRLLPGAIRLSGELHELAGTILRSPGQMLARAHALIGRGLVPDDQLGRIRPAAADRMAGLQRLLTTPTEAPGLVLAAVAHAEVATVSPFGFGDGLVARAVEQAVLIARGVDPQGVVPVCSGHRQLAEEYGDRLAGYADVSGVGPWIAYCARAVTHAAEQLGGRLVGPRP
ncbi:oxidoreductase [Microlunatus speluncae]|uniref:oxidoreductase n=1 Tax=Microlunatus speluncae TaxID=2594267 RepID=UPI0012660E83|nr:oxidoreductase [Microlunatus speluncae]